jgi:hypothetical protein
VQRTFAVESTSPNPHQHRDPLSPAACGLYRAPHKIRASAHKLTLGIAQVPRTYKTAGLIFYCVIGYLDFTDETAERVKLRWYRLKPIILKTYSKTDILKSTATSKSDILKAGAFFICFCPVL